jgi:hypothetical protein
MSYPKRGGTVGLTRPECHEDALAFPRCWQSHNACTSHVIDRRVQRESEAKAQAARRADWAGPPGGGRGRKGRAAGGLVGLAGPGREWGGGGGLMRVLTAIRPRGAGSATSLLMKDLTTLTAEIMRV